MSRSSINILAEQYAKAMAAVHGGEVDRYLRSFARTINFHEIDTASQTLIDAATALDSFAITPPPKDDRWTQQLGDNGEADWLRDQAELLNDQRYDDEVINAPLAEVDTRTAAALERIAQALENDNLIAAFHASLEPGSQYELPTDLGQALDTQELAQAIADRIQPERRTRST